MQVSWSTGRDLYENVTVPMSVAIYEQMKFGVNE